MAEANAGALSLDALVANRTMSSGMSATLKAAIRARRSFIVIAIPRLAGKSTVMHAMLRELPRGTPVKTLAIDGTDLLALRRASAGGYLVIPEIVTRAGTMPGYISGKPVRTAFADLPAGTSLAATLHAPGATEALDQICGNNKVPVADAATLGLAVYIRSLGDKWELPTRRVVTTMHEVLAGDGARPGLRLLHRWDEASDAFEDVAKASWA